MNKTQIMARFAVLGYNTRPASASMQVEFLHKEDNAPIVLITFDDGSEQQNLVFTPAVLECDETTPAPIYTDDDIRAAIYGGPSPLEGTDIIEGEDGFVHHEKHFEQNEEPNFGHDGSVATDPRFGPKELYPGDQYSENLDKIAEIAKKNSWDHITRDCVDSMMILLCAAPGVEELFKDTLEIARNLEPDCYPG
jgi:hypothetical protein